MQDAITVTQLTQRIKGSLEQKFDSVILQGEISSLVKPSSGHFYFTVKDQKSQIAGVMFRFANQKLRFQLQNGTEVILRGKITVYEPRGTYQLLVTHIDPIGDGALQLAFDQLKQKLVKEGLFDPQHKKEIPFLPQKIGIVTSPTGAAVQDILNVLERRFPSIPVVINPTQVQGANAGRDIAKAINDFQLFEDIDVLIVGRGGGSLEDLWAFNEEIVARAIFASKIPIVSAVGHEIDFTIADFVADERVPTPTAAAERVVPNRFEIIERLALLDRQLASAMKSITNTYKTRFEQTQERLQSPDRVIQAYIQRTDELTEQLKNKIQNKIKLEKLQVESLIQQLLLSSPKSSIQALQEKVTLYKTSITRQMKQILEKEKLHLEDTENLLNSVSPLSSFQRGYSIATNHKKKLISSVDQVEEGDQIQVRVQDGNIQVKVESITKIQ
ncbi:MAG: exodeoxyribonuclease VII large subunit [bacterium]|jgi:exodeoxyribonuclease VII large subunit